ncbi:Homeobox protein VENTX [Aphelenchoides avenae]|nr:Homeobox protein VENTX [Aphelenchus avenae]
MSSNSQPSTTEPINTGGEGRRSSGRTPRKVYAEPKPFTFNENQRALMEASFQRNRVLTAAEMKRLAQESGAPESSIRNWFQTRRNKERRRLLADQLAANGPAANDNPAHQVREPEVQSAVAVEAGNHPVGGPAADAIGNGAPATPNANAVNGQETPQARAVREWLRGQMQQHAAYQTPPVPVQQPAQAPPPPAKAAGNELVEASGRAMILRLRQLHKKDPKLFLQAQHAVGNAIFKYEMEVDE